MTWDTRKDGLPADNRDDELCIVDTKLDDS